MSNNVNLGHLTKCIIFTVHHIDAVLISQNAPNSIPWLVGRSLLPLLQPPALGPLSPVLSIVPGAAYAPYLCFSSLCNSCYYPLKTPVNSYNVFYYLNLTTLRSGICYRKSVCCLYNIPAPYTQPVEIFGNVSTPFLYPSYPLTSMHNFIQIVLGNSSIGGLNVRGVDKYSDVGHVEGYSLEAVQDTTSGTNTDQ